MRTVTWLDDDNFRSAVLRDLLPISHFAAAPLVLWRWRSFRRGVPAD